MIQPPIDVIYVDDARFDRELVRHALAHEPDAFHLREASSREDLEQALAEPPHVVLTDFNILGYDGLQVIDAVHARLPDVPVIVVTGTGSEQIAIEAMRRGAADYVIKTLRHINRLPATIRAALTHRALEERVRQGERMDAVGLMAAGLAHDFNNVLTAINGFADLIEHAVNEPERGYAIAIREAVQRGAAMTRSLLGIARRQPHQPERVDGNVHVRGLQRMLAHVAGPAVAVEWSLAADPAHIRIDPTQFEQVMLNLFTNAKTAMPGPGRIIVTTRTRPGDDPGAGPRWLVLTVQDSGVGMDAATRARVFEPFFTTRPDAGGTGLGLATVFGIVTQNGGQISVASAPGRGATFTILLPLAVP